LEQQAEFEETCERYLLGELSEAEQERFEEAYFADNELFEQFQSVKDDLLDAYARGELDEEKRRRFAAHFLASASNRWQLEEMQNFIRAVTEVSTKTSGDRVIFEPVSNTAQKSSWLKSLGGFFSPRPFAWQAAFAVLLLLALAGIWLILRDRQPSATIDQAIVHPTPLPTFVATPNNENQNTVFTNNNINTPSSPTPGNVNKTPANASPTPTNVNTSQSPANVNATPEKTPARTPQNLPAQVASVVLMPFATRSIGESNTLRLGPDTRTVNLRLVFKGEDYPTYSVTVATVGGAVVLQRKIPGGNKNKSIALQFAAAILRQQDYIVTLKGTAANGQTETIGEYYFHVERSLTPNTTPGKQP
jgi:hypothetical protein